MSKYLLVPLFAASMIATSFAQVELTQEDYRVCFQVGDVYRNIAKLRDANVQQADALEITKKRLPNESTESLSTATASVYGLTNFSTDAIYGFFAGTCVGYKRSGAPLPPSTPPKEKAAPKEAPKDLLKEKAPAVNMGLGISV